MGYLMDRWGTRLGLSVAVLLWSTATGAQIFARTGVRFGFVRYWMGTGECGNFSGCVKTVTRLFAKKGRTLAIGIINSGSMLGATIAPPLIIFLMQRHGFRTAFLVPAFAGILWVPLWWFSPAGARPTSGEPFKHLSSRELLRSSSAWAVMVCRFFNGPVLQIYWYWILSYLYSIRHLSMTQLGLLDWIPFLLGDAGGVAGEGRRSAPEARIFHPQCAQNPSIWQQSAVLRQPHRSSYESCRNGAGDDRCRSHGGQSFSPPTCTARSRSVSCAAGGTRDRPDGNRWRTQRPALPAPDRLADRPRILFASFSARRIYAGVRGRSRCFLSAGDISPPNYRRRLHSCSQRHN